MGCYLAVGDDVVGLISRDERAAGVVGEGVAGIGRVIGEIADAEAVGEVKVPQMGVQADVPFAGDPIDPVAVRNDAAGRCSEVVIGKAQLLVSLPF